MQPAFLIIGAMKAGTTTLYRDLARHPDIFLPGEKEPDILVREDLAEIRVEYESLFKGAKPGQFVGEASTAYTKRPTHEGVAERALAVCGPGLKLIYITRDPIKRMISQYQHEQQYGLVAKGFRAALDARPELIDYSRYDWQLAPWIAAFGEDNVLRLTLEDYSRNREALAREVIAFIGADPARMPDQPLTGAANRAEEAKRYPEGSLMERFFLSRFYQRRLKPLFPDWLRERARNAVLPQAEVEEIVIDDALRADILRRLGTSA